MNRIFGLFLLLVAFNVSAIEINSKLSGSWFNSDQDGHGLNVATLDEDFTLVYWYVYHTDGTPMFLITVGKNEGNRTSGTTYYHTGMKFGDFNPDDVQQTVWGTSTVTFTDCNTATLEYSADDPAYGGGTIPMTRLTFVSGLKCSDSPLHGTYHVSLADGASGEIAIGAAVLFENRDMAYLAGSDAEIVVGLGQWRVTSNDAFAFDATVYSLEGGWYEISGSGAFSEDGLEGDYTAGGKLIATPVLSFQRSLSTKMLAGTYDIWHPVSGVIGTGTISDNGQANGGTLDGCDISGGVWSPNSVFNQAYVDVNLSNCSDAGRVLGAATYIHKDQTISVIASDGWYGYVWTLK